MSLVFSKYLHLLETTSPSVYSLNFAVEIVAISKHVVQEYGGLFALLWRWKNSICCHAYRVNCLWEEAENQYVNRLTIEPQTFCGFKVIELKPDTAKNQQCVIIT